MTFNNGPGDPFGGSPFGQFPTGQPPYGQPSYGQPPYGGPPMVSAPPPQPPNAKANTFATLSVVFAFLFAPAGAVLGHLGLSQIKRTGEPGRDRALIGVILSYVFIVVAVVALVIWLVLPSPTGTPAAGTPAAGSTDTAAPTSTTTSPTPTTTRADLPLVTQAQLPGLMLSLEEVKRVLGADDNGYTATDTAGLNESPGVRTTPDTCRPALFAGATDVYLRSSSTATFSRSITHPDVWTMFDSGGLEERVMLFPNATAAAEQVAEIEKRWRGCVGHVTQTVNFGSVTSEYQVDPVTRAARDPSIVILSSTILDGPQGTQNVRNIRVIAAKSNVVVDMVVFGRNPGDSAEVVTAGILARIPG